MQRLKLALGKSLRFAPDTLYLYIYFYAQKKEFLKLKNPKRFTEKIQWLKLNGNLERYSEYADKYAVRDYIEKKIGAEYLIPLIGAWDSFDDIPFDKLPKRFVLKTNHGCGYNFICKDKSTINYDELKKTVNKWMSENFYEIGREPQYRSITPKIICEEYLEDETGGLTDYKFFCSKGTPEVIQFEADRFSDRKSDMLDVNWKRLSYLTVANLHQIERSPKKPENLQAMLKLARKLSQDFPFVRVDLYSVDNKIYFGELTFTPGGGMVDLSPVSGDIEFGKLVDLDAYSVGA